MLASRRLNSDRSRSPASEEVSGVTSRRVTVTNDANAKLCVSGIDRRKNTFIGIKFPTFPIYESVTFQFFHPIKGKVKFWDLFIFACCEVLTTQTTVSGVSRFVRCVTV